ncbi:methyltransferase N6AMT1-like [Actinia tenebrosa]|uniref:Methyltransferase HEMK2 n=1 Tax=Actinia tenebrosa TaxID=6105 RepID=A0A6P8ILF5_ACTTE|nr:methyltransferase N6AMT1-like [Actinia tenebrosa]
MANIPTPVISHLSSKDYQDVYEPAEDSFLMMDALEKDVEFLKERRPTLCVEVGSGSGVLISFLASILGNSAYYLTTDINAQAAVCTRKTVDVNGYHVCPVVTNLLDGLIPRLNGKVDVLLFNPPYVVTPSHEVGSFGIEASWAGGVKGREVIDKFLPLVPSLLSKTGCFYLVTIAENKPEEIKKLLQDLGNLGCTTVMQRRAGPERLSILKFTH